jgi:hypothetical protein
MSEHIMLERRHWVLIIVLSVVLSVIGTIDMALCNITSLSIMCHFTWGIYARTTALPIAPVFLLLLMFPLKRFMKISTQTLVSLYIVGLVMSYYGFQDMVTFALHPVAHVMPLLYSSEQLRAIMLSWWWMPPYDVVKQVVPGNMAVDWIAWAPNILFWTLYMYTFFFFTSSFMLLLRRRWIDIERVPFPHVLATNGTLDVVKGEQVKTRDMRPYIMGFILGAAIEVEILLTFLFPWWPDIFGYRVNTSAVGCWCLPAGGSLMDSIVHWGRFTKDPLAPAVLYLAPLDILFSFTFFTIVMILLDQVAYVFGFHTGILTMGGGCRDIYTDALYWTPPFYWAWLSLGGILAMAIMVLWHSRHYLAETFQSALQGKTSEGEVFSYRNIYIMIVLSAIVLMCYQIFSGITIAIALVGLGVTFLQTITDTYALGIAGSPFVHEKAVWMSWPLHLIWPQPPSNYSTEWIMAHGFLVCGWNVVPNGIVNGAHTTMSTMKMCQLTGVDTRNVFLTLTLSMIVVVPIMLVTRLWIYYLLGTSRVTVWGTCGMDTMWDSSIDRYASAGPTSTLFEGMLVGAIITVALSLLRARFVWMPLNPLGFPMATAVGISWWGSWNAFVFAWVAKYITLRVGGSKLYENYGIPFVGGFLGGLALVNIMAHPIGVIRFFYPF